MSGDLFGPTPESHRERMARFRAKVEAPFIRNQYGLWCPQCGEQIADWEWVGDCDCCGYPSEIEDECDDDMTDRSTNPIAGAQSGVEVIQEDREAAVALIRQVGLKTEYLDEIEDGSYDENFFTQAFARHRLATEARIVAWLRSGFPGPVPMLFLTIVADAIEKGAHRG